MIITKHDAATGRSESTSLHVTAGNFKDGKPPEMGPMTAMPCPLQWNALLAAIVAATANRDRGHLGAKRLPSRMPPATTADSASVGRFDSGRPFRTSHTRTSE